jgi:proteasome accessory factor C
MSRRRTSEQRLSRLLVMLPWLMERESVPLTEVAERFGLSEAEVTEDLELASLCGLPPYADELIDLYIDDGVVFMGVPRVFTRPLQLTSVEAFELLVAVRAALRLPGVDRDGALVRGFDKLAAALGEPAMSDDDVTIEIEQPPAVDELLEAVRRAEIVEIEYWSPPQDVTALRRMVPRQVFTDRGRWYVTGIDVAIEEIRTFRIDRIVSLQRTGEFVDPPDDELPAPGEWFQDPTVTRARVRLPTSLVWLIEKYPIDQIEYLTGADRADVVLPVTSEHWLARLMVRLGPAAEVVEPEQWRDLGRTAAAAILGRYGSG